MASTLSDEEKIDAFRRMAAAWEGKQWRTCAALLAPEAVLHSMMLDPVVGRETIYQRKLEPDPHFSRACVGCLLGTAVGDALGLPYEGLSPRRAARLFPGTPRHRLLFGRGLVSDDTEHACFTARALLLAQDDVDAFGRHLAASLRWWFAGLPAGIGLATLRAAVKSCIGFPPERSGVFSAGNGPAMRSPIIGVLWGAEPARMLAFVRRSTRLTHTDPKAFHGAAAVALAAHHAATGRPREHFVSALESLLAQEDAGETLRLVRAAWDSARSGEPLGQFAQAIGSRGGISGYMLHTVPCVLQVWLRGHDDFPAALAGIIQAGGDTDTAAAIYGGIAGAGCGAEAMPQELVSAIIEWPRSVAWMQRLGTALATRGRVPGYFVPAIPVRNALFLLVVLAHGFRRLAPPY